MSHILHISPRSIRHFCTGIDDIDRELVHERMKRNHMRMVNVNYSSMISSTDDVDLYRLCSLICGSKFTKHVFPKRRSRIGNVTLTRYTSKTKMVGVKSKEKVRFMMHMFRLVMGCMPDGRDPRRLMVDRLRVGTMMPMNIVCMAWIAEKYMRCFNTVASNYPHYTSYLPDLFPACILKHRFARPSFTAVMYDTGSIIFAGLKDESSKVDALRIVLYHLYASRPTRRLRDDFYERYFSGRYYVDVTSRAAANESPPLAWSSVAPTVMMMRN